MLTPLFSLIAILASPAWTTDVPAVDTVEQRFAAPPGFMRVKVEKESFGAFLRSLPLAAAGTPVKSFAGKTLYTSHPNIAAIVAMDIGNSDLQQCADSVIRMHAEWQWSIGKRDQHYTTTGPEMFYANYVAGDRYVWTGGKLTLKKVLPSTASHESFRAWLDQVFGAANTGSLAREAKPIEVKEMQPGDFVVMPGVPFGHAVLIVDLARDTKGRRVALLGQGFMPAQSFHILRRSPTENWFPIDEASGKLETPFWQPFPFSALRRL